MADSKNQNNESVVKCPVDGCSEEKLARGIHLHVRQSSDAGHGIHGDIPDNLNFDDLTEVGTQSVKMDYPSEQTMDDVVRLCPYCGNAFKGYRGLKIHLGQKQGQGVHPDDATDITKEDTPVAHVDEDMNVIEIVEEGKMMPSTKRRISGDDSVPIEDVQELVRTLEGEGKDDFAQRIKDELL